MQLSHFFALSRL